ncbi:Epiphycan [Myotis davidii]|uniref:Epiphycan n=1 Tax=Myotis davidii TaxID=225400 RepID=L5M5C8_MYODS|nr:Epiphycan [Myotis davidii]
MKALARLVLGLVIFDAAVTAPTLEPINYDSETYDATLEDLDDLYNYENIPIGQAEGSDAQLKSCLLMVSVLPQGERLSARTWAHSCAVVEVREAPATTVALASHGPGFWLSHAPGVGGHWPPGGSSCVEHLPLVVSIEIATMMPSGNRELLTPPPQPEEAEEEEEEESTPRLIDGFSPQEPEFTRVLGPHTSEDFPTCLLCTCISTTVYCDDHELDTIPPLPKNTAYFYSRFNRIKKINRNDFANLNDLRKIDLTSNLISEIDEDAFKKLPELRELILRDNKIRQLPDLPSSLTFIDVSNNRLGRKGIKQEAFKDMYDLHHLYLTDNNLDHIPLPLPENLRALHLQVGFYQYGRPNSSMENKSTRRKLGPRKLFIMHVDSL